MGHGWRRSRCRSRRDNAPDVAQTVRAAALSPQVYGWFTEGFGTRDLKEAKALLEELGARGRSSLR